MQLTPNSFFQSIRGTVLAAGAYGPNFEWLVALKNDYDPTNFFRLNQNIAPRRD